MLPDEKSKAEYPFAVSEHKLDEQAGAIDFFLTKKGLKSKENHCMQPLYWVITKRNTMKAPKNSHYSALNQILGREHLSKH